MDLKYQAVVIGKRDLAEVDRIYILYTREAGKISALGKGVRRPNAKLAGNLETITFSDVFISRNKGMGKITGSIPIENFPYIKHDLDVLKNALYSFSVLDKFLIQEEKDEKIFDLVVSYLKALNNIKDKRKRLSKTITLGFLYQLFEKLGYQTQVFRCVSCDEKLASGENYFSPARGGMLCPNCGAKEKQKMKINDSSIKILRIFSANKLEHLRKIKVSTKELEDLDSVFKENIRWLSS